MKVIKVDFSKKGKDLYYMKKQLRKEQKDTSENQKVKILLDKQNMY